MGVDNHELRAATVALESAAADLAEVLGLAWEPERRAWDLEKRRLRVMLKTAGLMTVVAEHLAGGDQVGRNVEKC